VPESDTIAKKPTKDATESTPSALSDTFGAKPAAAYAESVESAPVETAALNVEAATTALISPEDVSSTAVRNVCRATTPPSIMVAKAASETS
jgi:hypothetical protein